MTATETQVETTTEKAPPPQPVAFLGIVPLFVADRNEMDEFIEEVSKTYKVFYLLAEETKVTTTKVGKNKTSTTHTEPGLYRFSTHIAGTALTKVEEGSIGIAKVDPSATFNLPPIPQEIIFKIDNFFRAVHKKLGTEAIVLLTYRPSYLETDEPGKGWGVLIPKQKNTMASCDYEPGSVIDKQPDDAFIVGSCHSHPGMDAYCSGTDKADQAHFDGLHITFGWSHGSQTEFHVELQMNSYGYLLDEKLAMEGIQVEDDEDLDEWMGNVDKKTPPKTTPSTKVVSYSRPSFLSPADRMKRYPGLPEDCPPPSEVSLIASTLLQKDELKECPVCQRDLTPGMKEKFRCGNCFSYLLWNELELEELVEERRKIMGHSRELSDDNPYRDIWIWEEQLGKDGRSIIDEVYCLVEGVTSSYSRTLNKNGSSGKADGGVDELDELLQQIDAAIDSNLRISFHCQLCEETTLAGPDDEPQTCYNCGASLEMYGLASYSGNPDDPLGLLDATAPGEWEEISEALADWEVDTPDIDFYELHEEAMDADREIYRENAECNSCVFQYAVRCKPYRDWLKAFYDNPNHFHLLDKCKDFERY